MFNNPQQRMGQGKLNPAPFLHLYVGQPPWQQPQDSHAAEIGETAELAQGAKSSIAKFRGEDSCSVNYFRHNGGAF